MTHLCVNYIIKKDRKSLAKTFCVLIIMMEKFVTKEFKLKNVKVTSRTVTKCL